jgi:hypothetical protein
MKTKSKPPKPFGELEREWYQKLAKSGFVDIEDTANPERPLKQWHSRKFCSERSRIRQGQRKAYDEKISAFINSPSFHEICALIAQHWNNKLTPRKIKRLLELHRGGLSERKIAEKLKCGKKSVHLTLVKARQWMEVA